MLPLLPILASSAIGAGIGYATGGKKGAAIGAGLGAVGGWALAPSASGGLGLLGSAAKTGAASQGAAGGLTFGAIGQNWMAGNSITALNATAGAGAGAAAGGSFLGSTLTNPLLLGTVGMGLAAGFAKQGNTFQDKIALSAEGKEMIYGNRAYSGNTPIGKMGGLVGSVRDQWEQAKMGANPDKIAPELASLRVKEQQRYMASKTAQDAAVARLDNAPYQDRGQAAKGGYLGRMALADASERMEGLFNPTSLLNSYRREELINAMGNLQNIQNMENQTAMVNYQGQLSKWLGNQMLAAQRGAAIGGALSTVGNFALNQAYMSRLGLIA